MRVRCACVCAQVQGLRASEEGTDKANVAKKKKQRHQAASILRRNRPTGERERERAKEDIENVQQGLLVPSGPSVCVDVTRGFCVVQVKVKLPHTLRGGLSAVCSVRVLQWC